MTKYAKKSSFSILKIFQTIGRPSYLVLKFILVAISSYFHLLILFGKQVSSFYKKLFRPHKRKLVKKTKKATNFIALIVTVLVLITGGISLVIYFYILKDLPSVKLLSEKSPSLSTKILDRNGTLLYQIYKDENRSLISLNDLPPHVIQATLSAEDKNFYHHPGIDIAGVIRASINNFKCSLLNTTCTIQGGSTITQQLIKNTLLTPEKTLTRKIKELILAFETEHYYTKDQILEMYLNQVGYGGTAYGIEEASWQYFGKSARSLDVSESALLAGLPISPTILSPFGTNPYLSKIRQQQVLESMVQSLSITEDAKVKALSTPLVFHPQGISIRAPHFVMYVKDLLVKEYGEAAVARGGLTVTTTLDLSIQDLLQKEVNDELQKLNGLHVQNGAGLVVNPKNGEILAMVGSRNFFDSEHDGQVNLVLQERQPGSSIKPITYALALSNGLSPSSYIEDSPICFVERGQPDYCPKNYDGKFHGQVTLKTALASSYNIPAIKLLNSYGLKNMITLAKQLGITTWDDSSRFGLSLTLGGGEVKMIDLASVYAVFANGGEKVPFNPIIEVRDGKSNLATYLGSTGNKSEALSPAVAYQINMILSDPSARAPAFGINSVLNLPGSKVAVKTGTTNSLRDNWTFGYTPDLLVATWVGNNDNTSMSSVASGITGASPIWARTMKKLLENKLVSPFNPPENIVRSNISCTTTPRYEYFIKGTEPKIHCTEKIGTLLNSAASTAQ